LIINGLEDSVVGIPKHGHGEAFFRDLQDRTAQLTGSRTSVFDVQLIPAVSHRPLFVTRPAAMWLERHLDFPHWTEASLCALPETHIGRWAAAHGVVLDPLYAIEDREGGTPALGENVPALTRTKLHVFSQDEWEREKPRLIYESWRESVTKKPIEPKGM
jgi:hypothetical protein